MTHAGSCKFGNSVLEFGAVGLLVHLCGNSFLASQSPDNGKESSDGPRPLLRNADASITRPKFNFFRLIERSCPMQH
jgi:hypothetical protein